MKKLTLVLLLCGVAVVVLGILIIPNIASSGFTWLFDLVK